MALLPSNLIFMKLVSKIACLSLSVLLIQACKTPVATLDTPVEIVALDTVQINSDSKLELYRASEKRINDLLHTKLEVSFDWDSAFLYGQANLRLSPYFYPTDSLTLDAKGFQIKKVALVDSIGKQSPLKFVYDDSFLKIQLGKTYTKEEEYTIFVDYIAMPNKLEAGGSAAITEDKGLYFINNDGSVPNKPKQIWTQGETEASSCWFPTIDSPNEKTTQEIYITVDTNYVTLSNGELVFQTENPDGTRTDYWKQNLPHAPYLFMMAVGEFAIVEDQWRDIPVNYYVEPKYKAFAKDIYPNTPEMIEFFSNKLGYDYPWDKYHQVVVRDYVSGAMENTGAVIFGDFVQGNDRYLIDNSGEDVVAHELFHHWFGDLVTCESWSNLPLNESFATYGEHLWNEYKYGKDQGDLHGRNDLKTYLGQSRVNKKDLIRFNYNNEMEMFDAHSYQKGGRVLHMLRDYIGDDAFFASLKLYLKSNAFQTVEIHNLRLAVEKVTGEDMNWFFSQWFLGAGHPIIEVNKNYVDSTNTLEIIIEQTQDGPGVAEIFEIPTQIGIVDKKGKLMVKDIRLTKRKQLFSYEMDEAPALVNFDWKKTLLGEVDQDIRKSEAIALYNNANNYVDKSSALKMLKKKKDSASLDVIAQALDDSFWFIRKEAINNGKYLSKKREKFMFNKLTSLAKNDKKSNVRAAAVAALSKYFEEEVSVKFLGEKIEDRSYVVASTSLDALYEKDRALGIKQAEQLEDVENNSILLTIARIYSEEGTPKRNDFYKKSFSKLNGFGKYPLLTSYGEYLEKQDDQAIEQSLPLLKEQATGDDSWFIRMAAINSVVKIKKNKSSLIEELTEKMTADAATNQVEKLKADKEAAVQLNKKLDSTLKEIKDQETNSNLIRILEAGLK